MSYEKVAQELFDEVLREIRRVGERPVAVATLYQYITEKFPEMYIQEVIISTNDTEDYLLEKYGYDEEYFERRFLYIERRSDGSLRNREQVFWRTLSRDGVEIHFFNLPIMGDSFLMASSDAALVALQHEIQEYFKRPSPALTVYTDGGFQASEHYDNEVLTVGWEDIILPDSIKNGIYDIVAGFPESKERYNRLGAVHKRGIMMLGPPGCGKTMVCKASSALARDVNMKVLYVKDLVGVGSPDSTIKEIFSRAREMKPCLLLFEDIEGIVHGTSRSVFLNELDGFNSNDGLVVMATTNYPERLDPAILKRPARFDRIYKVERPNFDMRYEFILHMLNSYDYDGYIKVSPEEFSSKIANKTEKLSIPYIKESMISAALKLHDGDGGDFQEMVLENIKEMEKTARAMDDPQKIAEYESRNPIGAGFGSNGRE